MDAGEVDAIRVDHPDGLSNPGDYMRMLRAAIGPDRWLVVEKILGVGEQLPASWTAPAATRRCASCRACSSTRTAPG